MATHALITPTVPPRRAPLAEAGELRRPFRDGGISAPVIPILFPRPGENLTSLAEKKRDICTQLEALITDALDMLDGLDGDTDLEPDADGEAEPDEASAQPFTFSMDRFPPVVHRPSAAEMRRAYRKIGAPIPGNLRFDIFGRART
jgi:hypothetical protein